MPASARSTARLRAVWPPTVGSRANLPELGLAASISDFDADDLFDVLVGERLDVGAVGELGIGHDGGRVRVDQHHLVALLLEGFAGLRAGVVELGRLADDDGAGADHEDLLNVISAWHCSLFFLASDWDHRNNSSGSFKSFQVTTSGVQSRCLLVSGSSLRYSCWLFAKIDKAMQGRCVFSVLPDPPVLLISPSWILLTVLFGNGKRPVYRLHRGNPSLVEAIE